MGNTDRRNVARRRPVVRRTLAVAASVSLLVGTASSSAMPPAQHTDAAFTHAQSAQAQTVSAATVPPVANLSCSGSLLLGRITINWSHPQMSMTRQGYQIQRFAPNTSTPTNTYTVGPDTTQYRNRNLALLENSRWEVRTMGPGGWVSAPWAMDVVQLATALNCTARSGPS